MGYAIKPDGGWRMVSGIEEIVDDELYSELSPDEKPNAWSVWTVAGWTPNLALARIAQAKQLCQRCRETNHNGFTSTALDGVTPYFYSTDNSFADSTFDGIDMLYLSAAHSNAVANKDTPGWSMGYPCKSPSDLIFKEYNHTAAQMLVAAQDGLGFIKANRQKLRLRLLQVAVATTEADILAVTWD